MADTSGYEKRLDGFGFVVDGQIRPEGVAAQNQTAGLISHDPLDGCSDYDQHSEAAARKALPITSGVLDYFPDALLEVARCSKVGNDQHNPGQPLHWAKEKSTDEADALVRHLLDRGKIDTDGVRHSAKVAWRALALLQREIESERKRNIRP